MNSSDSRFERLLRWEYVITLFLAACVIPLNSTDSGIFKGPIVVIGAAFGLAIFFVSVFLRRGIELRAVRILAVVALHALLFVLSAIWTFDRVYTWNALAFGLSCLAFFLLGSHAFKKKEDVDFLFRCVEWLTGIVGIIAAAQLLIPAKLPIDFHTGSGNRVPSLLGNSAYFSSFLAIVFPIILARTLFHQSDRKRSVIRIGFLVAVSVLLFSTQTRSSIAGWIGSVVLFTALTWKSNRARISGMVIGSLTIAAVVYLFAFHPGLAGRYAAMFSENRESTFARRTYFWAAGRDAFLASPVFGHGIGSFERSVFEYRSPDYWMANSEDVVPHAHNEIIEIAVEFGSAGLLLCGFLVILTLGRIITLIQKTNGWQRWIISGIASALAAIVVDNLANVSLRQPPIAALVWLLLGIVWSPPFSSEDIRTYTVPARVPRIFAIAPLILFIGFLALYVPVQVAAVSSRNHAMNGLEAEGASPAAALADLRLAVADDPINLVAYSRLAMDFANSGQWEAAIRATGDLQRLSPFYPKSSFTKGYALLRLGRYRESQEVMEREIRRRDHPEAYWIQAAAYRATLDTAGERGVLANLIRKDIRGGILYEAEAAVRRFAELSRSPSEQKEAEDLLDSLEVAAPGLRDSVEQLRHLPHSQR